MIEVQLSVITMDGEMITEDFIETRTLCEYCGEEVKPNGKVRTVSTPFAPDPRRRAKRTTPDFTRNFFNI